MCHGCVYTGSFVVDYHALYLQQSMSRIGIEIPYRVFRNGSDHEFYRLKALITLKQFITSVVEKRNNRNHEQNFEVYWKTRMEEGGTEDRGSGKKKLENKINK